MRRILFGLAVAAIAVSGPHWCAAGEKEDKDATQQIARVLRDSGRVQNYAIGVKYQAGTAWLAGTVTSEAQMQAALEVVSEIKSVQRIVNNLEVKSKTRKSKQPKSSAQADGSAANQVNQAAAQMPTPDGTPAPAKKKTKRGPSVYRGVPTGYSQLQPAQESIAGPVQGGAGRPPMPAFVPGTSGGVAPAAYDQPNMPNYAWPSYAASPNYAAVTYPRQYSATAWPFIGPFYPYPQVPMGWRKVSLEWDDGWWFLDFDDRGCY